MVLEQQGKEELIAYIILWSKSALFLCSADEIRRQKALNYPHIPAAFISGSAHKFSSVNWRSNSKENMNDYINECQTMYKEVFQKYFKSKEQLNILLDRANDEIAKLQIKLKKI